MPVAETVQKKIEILSTMAVIVVDVEHIVEAIKLHRLSGFSFWDCLVLRCAKAAGCARLLSEDLQHGRAVEGSPSKIRSQLCPELTGWGEPPWDPGHSGRSVVLANCAAT